MEKNLADNDKTSNEDSINTFGQFRNFKKENKKSKLKRGNNSTSIIKEVIDESDETRTSINENRYTASTDSNLDSKLDSKLDSEIEKNPSGNQQQGQNKTWR